MKSVKEEVKEHCFNYLKDIHQRKCTLRKSRLVHSFC